jgi:endonuclease III
MQTLEVTSLKDSELNAQIKSLVQTERQLLEQILLHIAEVDRRKLYLKMAYSSLFEYLTEEIGYSAASAQRRIDAARLSQKVPEVLTQIQEGSINLSQISKVQQIVRQIKKESGTTVPLEVQKTVIEKLENKGARETDLILAQEFQLKIETKDKHYIQRDESVRVELTFTKEEAELLEKARAILSHKTQGSLKETLLEMARKLVKASEPKSPDSAVADYYPQFLVKIDYFLSLDEKGEWPWIGHLNFPSWILERSV